MKAKLCAILTAAWSIAAYAQGLIELGTYYGNLGTAPDATSRGLFWLSIGGSTALIDQDFNAAFYLGTDPNRLDLLATFLLSDGSAVGDNAAGPGTFTDFGPGYIIPGYHPYVFMQVQAWTGNSDSYAAAVARGALAGESPVFTNMVAYGTLASPGLAGMPAVILTIPEPAVLSLLFIALAGLGLRRTHH